MEDGAATEDDGENLQADLDGSRSRVASQARFRELQKRAAAREDEAIKYATVRCSNGSFDFG